MACIGTVLAVQDDPLSAMRFHIPLAVLVGLALLALAPPAASADGGADRMLDQVTDLMRVGRMDEALANLTTMQQAYPDHLRAWMVKGLILGYVGMADEGYAEADERLAADAGDGGGLALTTGIAIAEGDDAVAKEASAALVAEYPGSADAWDIRGGVLSMQSGDAAAQEARAAFDRALAIDPKHVDALINRGELIGPTDPDQAERFLRRAIDASPASTDANDAWTTFLVGQNRTADAIEAYDRWLEKQPANPIALMGKAIVLADEGRYDEALWLVESVVRDDPGNRDGLRLKGELLLALNRADEAVDVMNDLLAQYPDDEDAESLRSEAAAAVQATTSPGNATIAPTTPAAKSPVAASVAIIALAVLALAVSRRT
jgi:tetratricopeptide (TPR) repeat protein